MRLLDMSLKVTEQVPSGDQPVTWTLTVTKRSSCPACQHEDDYPGAGQFYLSEPLADPTHTGEHYAHHWLNATEACANCGTQGILPHLDVGVLQCWLTQQLDVEVLMKDFELSYPPGSRPNAKALYLICGNSSPELPAADQLALEAAHYDLFLASGDVATQVFYSGQGTSAQAAALVAGQRYKVAGTGLAWLNDHCLTPPKLSPLIQQLRDGQPDTRSLVIVTDSDFAFERLLRVAAEDRSEFGPGRFQVGRGVRIARFGKTERLPHYIPLVAEPANV
jgi:hypothetical protein